MAAVDSEGSYEITAWAISYTRSSCHAQSPAYILRDVSFTARPSQMLAIMGPSGAGKSTLLDILAARTAPSKGRLLLNSVPLHPISFRKLSGYVPQSDASLPHLTVFETFVFAARLLLPTTADISSVVATLLVDLRLSHVASTRLGRGLSGGERRRVSIGLSILHDPAVLFLDEPTSGLDSMSALNVMQTLRAISVDRGRTVILSIHQPSFKILSIIDSILLLSRGTVVHHGTISSLQTFLEFHGFRIPPQLSPLEYAMEVIEQLPQNPIYPDEQDRLSCVTDRALYEEPVIIQYRSTRFREVFALCNRYCKIICRTKQLLLTNAAEALGVGILLGTIYMNAGLDKQGMDKRIGLFAFTLSFLLSSTTETLPVFISERQILLRETASGMYRLSSHLIANTMVFLPYLLLIAIIYSTSVYFLVGLCPSWQAFSYFLLVIWTILLMANSLVLLLGSIAPNYIAGTSLVTIVLACCFLFSGYFISKDRMPKYWLFMHYISLYKYALDALLINEYSCHLSRCLMWYDEDKVCAITGRDLLDRRGLHVELQWTNLHIMLGFFTLFRVLCFLVLSRRVVMSKR